MGCKDLAAQEQAWRVDGDDVVKLINLMFRPVCAWQKRWDRLRRGAQALKAVVGSQVKYMLDTISSLRAPIANGQVKAIGVTSARSSRLLPGVKSVAEQGVAAYELVGWTVLHAPKGLSGAIRHLRFAHSCETDFWSTAADLIAPRRIQPS